MRACQPVHVKFKITKAFVFTGTKTNKNYFTKKGKSIKIILMLIFMHERTGSLVDSIICMQFRCLLILRSSASQNP